MIYVPDTSYQCYVIRDSNTLRAYEEVPRNNTTIQYRDYYINSHYLYQDGEQTFSQYATLPVCLDSSVITGAYGFRNDFADILLISIILIGSSFFLINKLVKCLFKGRKLF